MKKRFYLGNVDYEQEGAFTNRVYVEVELRDTKEGPVFRCKGNIQNSKNTESLVSGQCLDDIHAYFPNDQQFGTIYELWKQYHLNDMNAGTVEQTEALKKAKAEGININDYIAACNYLASIGLYEVTYKGELYQYGTGWLYHEIPKEDLTRIRELLGAC